MLASANIDDRALEEFTRRRTEKLAMERFQGITNFRAESSDHLLKKQFRFRGDDGSGYTGEITGVEYHPADEGKENDRLVIRAGVMYVEWKTDDGKIDCRIYVPRHNGGYPGKFELIP